MASFSFVRRIWPSAANFFLVHLDDSEELLARSSDAGILLRHFGGQLKDCVRISIGTPEENDRLLEVCRLMEEAA
jgi:histidinol-phosphate aminotransferase